MSDVDNPFDDPLVKIKSINKIAKHIGKDVANEMLIPIKEMKKYIKPKEIASLIKQYSIHKNDNYLMNTMILKKIFTETKNWVLGIQLAKMASNGEIDTIWDEEANGMVFKSK